MDFCIQYPGFLNNEGSFNNACLKSLALCSHPGFFRRYFLNNSNTQTGILNNFQALFRTDHMKTDIENYFFSIKLYLYNKTINLAFSRMWAFIQRFWFNLGINLKCYIYCKNFTIHMQYDNLNFGGRWMLQQCTAKALKIELLSSLSLKFSLTTQDIPQRMLRTQTFRRNIKE